MAALAPLFRPAVGRRLGWILEHHTEVAGLDALHRVVAAGTRTPSLLDSLSPARGHVDERWNLRINTEVEVEA